MAGEQGKLPLGKENTIPDEGARQSLPDVLNTLDRARKTVDLLVKAKDTSRAGRISALDKAIVALQEIEPARMLLTLNRERSVLVQSRDEVLKHRRENLARAAKEAGWPVKRLEEHDFAGGFQVSYKLEQVTLRLGSEPLTIFDEPDGTSLFSRLQEERSKLEGFPFARPDFIESIKGAVHLARWQGKDRDGKVPIRTLYPLFVLARQSRDSRFIKRPVAKTFTEYSMAQFVYDLARFGRDGWETDRGERLRNQPPNMASIAKGATVTLPSLDGDGSGGPQLGAVWIDRA